MKKTILLTVVLCISLDLSAKDTQIYCSDKQPYVVRDKAQKSNYANCKRNGMTWWYTDKGTIKSQVNFTQGKENGLYTSFYDNGSKKLTVNYTDGQKNGVQQMYYDTGVLGSKVLYKMGRREGVMRDWDEEGFKSSEVFYKHNYKVGLKKYFDHQGNVVREENYKMDRNPVVVQMLKNKRKEVFVDLAKYGLMPKSASKEQRFR